MQNSQVFLSPHLNWSKISAFDEYLPLLHNTPKHNFFFNIKMVYYSDHRRTSGLTKRSSYWILWVQYGCFPEKEKKKSFLTTNALLSFLIYFASPSCQVTELLSSVNTSSKKYFYMKRKMCKSHWYFLSQLDPGLYLPFLTYILPRFAELSFEILFLEYHDLTWQNFCRAAR